MVAAAHPEMYRHNCCPITKAAYVDILNLLFIRYPTDLYLDEPIHISDIQPHLEMESSPALIRAKSHYVILRNLRSYERSSSLGHSDNIFGQLAANMPNLCTTVLRDLAHALIVQPTLGNSVYLPRILLQLGAATEDDELAVVAYNLLAMVVERYGSYTGYLTHVSTLPLDNIARWSKTPSPAAVAAAVRASGTLLDADCTPNSFTEKISRRVEKLLHRIRAMIDANSVSVIIISCSRLLTLSNSLSTSATLQPIALIGFGISGDMLKSSIDMARYMHKPFYCYMTV